MSGAVILKNNMKIVFHISQEGDCYVVLSKLLLTFLEKSGNFVQLNLYSLDVIGL